MTRARVGRLLAAGPRSEGPFLGNGTLTVALGAKLEADKAQPSPVVSQQGFQAYERLCEPVLLRAHDEGADYPALADAVLLLDTADGLQVVSDDRVNQLAGKEREAANRVPTGSALKLRRRAQLTRALRRARNRPGGYWVAAVDPQAASQAVTGSLPSKTLHRAVLLTDGASWLVDPFGLPPGRRCSRCWTRAARRSCCARSAPPRPLTSKAGSGLGPSAATTRRLSTWLLTRPQASGDG